MVDIKTTAEVQGEAGTQDVGAQTAAPKVSVIVPVYNAATYLADCLASIERQTLASIEVLCIDDASTDESAAIVRKFAEADTRFKLLQMPRNVGPGAARNAAIQQAAGEYLAFMDADDWYPADTTLEQLYAAASTHNALIAGGSFSEYSAETGKLTTDFSKDPHLATCFTFEQEGFVDYRSWQGDYGYTRFLYKRSFILEHNITFPHLLRHEDPIFFVHAMLAAERFYAIPAITYCCRIEHKRLRLTQEAQQEAVEAIIYLTELSVAEDLPVLRQYQYEMLRWYVGEVPIKAEFGSWTELGGRVVEQAKESLQLRLGH